MGIQDDESIFLTQEEHRVFLLSQTEVNEEAEEAEQHAFENSIMEVHRKYNLRRKKENDNPPEKAAETKKATETKKIVEIKKTLETSLNKVPERNNAKSSTKRSFEILKKTKLDRVFVN
jgi:hypothetical protein